MKHRLEYLAVRLLAAVVSLLPMPAGVWLVSTTPITGIPSLFASCTAPFW